MKRVAVPVAIVVALALVPKFAIDIPYVFGGGLNTPGTLQLLALCLLFGGLALSYDLLFGFTGLLSFGHALYFAVGVYVAAIAMTRWHWSFWAGGPLHGARRVPARRRARSRLAAGRRHRLRDGDPGLRAGRLDPGAEESLRLDRRRGGIRRRLPPAADVGGRHPQHEVSLLAGARIRCGRVRDRPLGRQLVARPCVAGDPRERAARPGARAEAVHLQADVLRARVDARDGRRHHLPAAARRSEHAGDDRELHADAAADGRARRHRFALGRDDRRHPLHLRRPQARRSLVVRTPSRAFPRSSGRRCSSRSSSSACSSSWSCSSFPAG